MTSILRHESPLKMNISHTERIHSPSSDPVLASDYTDTTQHGCGSAKNLKTSEVAVNTCAREEDAIRKGGKSMETNTEDDINQPEPSPAPTKGLESTFSSLSVSNMGHLTPKSNEKDDDDGNDGSESDDQPDKSTDKEEVTQAPEPKPVRLFVGQVPETMVEPHLTALFQTKGIEVVDIAIIRDKHTARHRHCAFITVPSREQADRAIAEFHNKKYLDSMSNPMQVKEANQPKPKSIYMPMPPFQPGGAGNIGTIGTATFFTAPAKGVYKLPPAANNPGFAPFVPVNSVMPTNYIQQYAPQVSQFGAVNSGYAPYVYGYFPAVANVSGLNVPNTSETSSVPNVGYSYHSGNISAAYQIGAMNQGSQARSLGATPKSQSNQPGNFGWQKSPPEPEKENHGGQITSSSPAASYAPANNPYPINQTSIAYNQGSSQATSSALNAMQPFSVEKSEYQSKDSIHQTSISGTSTSVTASMSNMHSNLPSSSSQENMSTSIQQTTSTANVQGGIPYHNSTFQQVHRPGHVTMNVQSIQSESYGNQPSSMAYGQALSTMHGHAGTEFHANNFYGYQGGKLPTPLIAEMKSKPTTYVEGPAGANLFVNNLPEYMTDDDLLRLFACHGNILSYKVFVDKYTHRSKGFGFVSFGTVHEAQEAIKEKNGYEIEKDRRLIVELKRSKKLKSHDFF